MLKVNVYFDIDGVLIPTYRLIEDEVERRTGKPFSWDRYYLKNMGLDKKLETTIRSMLTEDFVICPNMRESDDVTVQAVMVAELISKLNMCRVAFATSRDEELVEEATKTWLKSYIPTPCRLGVPVLWCDDKNKVKKLVDAKCDVLVEDNLDIANRASSAGIRTYLVNAKYNKGPIIPGVKRIERCDLWDIYEDMRELSQEKEFAYAGEERN